MHVSPPGPAKSANMPTLTCLPATRCSVCSVCLQSSCCRFATSAGTHSSLRRTDVARAVQMLGLVPGSRLGHGPTSAGGASCAAAEDTSAAAPSAAAAALTT